MVAQARQGNCETSSRLRWRTTYLVPPPGPFQVPVRGRRLQFAACGQSATPISHRRLALFGGWASSRSEQGLHELLCRRGGGSRRPLSSRWRRKDPAPPFKLNGRRAPDPPTNRAESCARTCMKKQPLCSSLSFVGRRLLLTVLGCRRTDRQTGCHFLTPSLLVLPVSRHCVHCGGSGRGGSPQVGTDDQVPGIAAETVPLVRLDWGEGLAARRHASCNSWLLCSGGVPCGRCTVSGYLGVRGPPQPYFAAKSPWDRPPRQGGCACARGTVPPCGSRPPPAGPQGGSAIQSGHLRLVAVAPPSQWPCTVPPAMRCSQELWAQCSTGQRQRGRVQQLARPGDGLDLRMALSPPQFPASTVPSKGTWPGHQSAPQPQVPAPAFSARPPVVSTTVALDTRQTPEEPAPPGG